MKKPVWMAYVKRGLRQGSWPALQRYVVSKKIYHLPPVRLNTNSEFCVHVALCEAHATMLHWMLRSLLNHARTPFRVVIHDDGSCSETTRNQLEEKFQGLRFITRTEAARMIPPMLENYPLLKEWWPTTKCTIHVKWLDAYLLSDSRFILFLDPDVLFFASPQELFEPISTTAWMQDVCYMLEVDAEESVRLFGGCPLPPLNTGLGRIERARFNLDVAQRVLHAIRKPQNDMTVHAVITAQTKEFMLLPPSYCVASQLGLGGVVAKHYTNPYRFWFYEEGIPRVARDLELPLSRWLRERG